MEAEGGGARNHAGKYNAIAKSKHKQATPSGWVLPQGPTKFAEAVRKKSVFVPPSFFFLVPRQETRWTMW